MGWCVGAWLSGFTKTCVANVILFVMRGNSTLPQSGTVVVTLCDILISDVTYTGNVTYHQDLKA